MKRATEPALITVSFQCNSHRNGQTLPNCGDVSVGILSLEQPYCDRRLKYRVHAGVLYLGKSGSWRVHSDIPWYGNWCWNGVQMRPDTAADVVNWLLAKGYKPTVGPESVWDKIDRKERLTILDIMQCVEGCKL